MYRFISILMLTFPATTQAQPQPEPFWPWIPEPTYAPWPEFNPVAPPRTSQMVRRFTQPDIVLLWNEAALNAIKLERTPPPVAARNLAILHISIYDAVNSVARTHRSFHVQLSPPSSTSIVTSATVAGYQALAALYPRQVSRFNAILDDSLASIPEGIAKTDGITLGRKVAAKVLAWRDDDLKVKKRTYFSRSELGRWQPTPPDYTPPLLPEWSSVRSFAIRSPADFHPTGPPDLTSEDFIQAYWEVKSIGGAKSNIRTKDQTEIARFWADGLGTVTPPGHWNRIARTVAEDRKNTLVKNARLFAMLNVALADAGIVCWDCKFKFDFWRPVAAIRSADRMRNPILTSDSQWTPLLPTPPFPAYPSGHSTFSGAVRCCSKDLFRKR